MRKNKTTKDAIVRIDQDDAKKMEESVGKVLVKVKLDSNGKSLLHHYLNAKEWGYPGGKAEPDEEIEDAAVRELKERTGYHIDKSKLKYTGLKDGYHQFSGKLEDVSKIEPAFYETGNPRELYWGEEEHKEPSVSKQANDAKKMEESVILFKIGMKCLREAVGSKSDISKPQGKHDSIPPIPQDVKTIDIDNKKKAWLKKWWGKYKSTIKYGALGAIAIGLLLSAGIPWSQLFPYFSKSVGTALGIQAIMGAVNGVMPETGYQLTPPNIVIRDHDYFIKTETGEVKTTINQVMDIISQAENRVNIWKHETARAGTENELSSLLSHKGLEDNVIWRDTFTPGRQTVLSPEWEKLEESAGLKAILLKIESKIVTIDDFNELIQEATPESMRDRLRRRINVNQNTARSHQDDDGHAKMSLPVMADRVQPSRKRADRTQMQHGGKMGHRHSARTQKRTMSKSLKEAIEFFKGNIGRPIDQSLSTDISHTVLRNVATKLMGKPGINRDWLYNFCSSLSESVDDNGYNFQIVDEDCEPQNQADVICAEHSVQTAWAGEKQFAWESATQKHDNQEFSHDVSKWIEITGWTQRKLYNWLGY